MVRLDPKDRAGLPDRAFAYVDSRGRRRLPIHDAAHVRNALARFSQVDFEDEQSRETARLRLLNAAKRFKIVPIGFIAGQLRSERGRSPQHDLPSGFVTMLMTDIEGSTSIVHTLGPRYRQLIDDLWLLLRSCVTDAGGHEVEARADEFFAVFEAPRAAVNVAIAAQHAVAAHAWPESTEVRVRIGLHSGYPTSTADNYVGTDVNLASRICASGHGGQIVVSASTREAVKASAPDGIRFTALGSHRLRGLPDAVPLYQITAKGLNSRFPPLRTM